MSSDPAVDPEAFRAFEHAGWQRAAAHYPCVFRGLTVQAAEPLLDAVGARTGARLLDVATGPGFVAAAAAERGASVTGLDFSSAMLAEARRLRPDLEFLQGDAESLPFREGAFDAVCMAFGLLHLGRPERALSEARRVLRAGGRFGFTVWCPPEECIGFGIVWRAIEAHGNPDVPLPPGPPFFLFGEPEKARAALLAAGFAAPTVTRLPILWRLERPDDLLGAVLMGGVRTAAVLRGQTPEALGAIGRAAHEEVTGYRQGSAFELPMPAVMALAVKR